MVGHKIDKSCELSGLGQATVSGTTILESVWALAKAKSSHLLRFPRLSGQF